MKPGQKLFCVVKANAYGHGASRLAPVMEEAGADGFCVAMLDEGLELRRAQIVKPILVLGLQPAEEAALAPPTTFLCRCPAWTGSRKRKRSSARKPCS